MAHGLQKGVHLLAGEDVGKALVPLGPGNVPDGLGPPETEPARMPKGAAPKGARKGAGLGRMPASDRLKADPM
jgi:hypothetical protein